MTMRCTRLLSILAALLLSVVCFAPLQAGRAQDDAAALAMAGDAEAQYRLGRMYAAGDEVIQDFVQAHLWYNLAAAGRHPGAAKARDALAAKMSADQIAQAQALARAWKPTAAAPTPAAPAPAMAGDPLVVLFAAIEGGDAGAVSAVLGAVPDVNVRDGQGWTPLAAAALGGDAAVLAALLGAGADPNLANGDGVTPLMVAAVQGHRAAAEALLAAGAEAGAKRADGLTAAKLAELQGHAALVALLLPPATPSVAAAAGSVVVQRNANLREGPGTDSRVLTVVPAGTTLTITGTTADGAWHRVALPEGQAGFIHSSLVGGSVTPKAPEPRGTFRDCPECPEMVAIPAGSFLMGSPASDTDGEADERPQHRVTISEPFALGKHEVTFAEWDACVAAGGCRGHRPSDEGWGRGTRPVIHVSWNDAQAYVTWLSRKTGWQYRLATEAEWEYAARAGTQTDHPWGDDMARCRFANVEEFGIWECSDGHDEDTAPVGSYPAYGYGLHDMIGNVAEWVEDCYADSYSDASAAAAPLLVAGCDRRVLRGGSWSAMPSHDYRSANREGLAAGSRHGGIGFRVARKL